MKMGPWMQLAWCLFKKDLDPERRHHVQAVKAEMWWCVYKPGCTRVFQQPAEAGRGPEQSSSQAARLPALQL